MSAFDPDRFLSAPATGANSTEYTPVPEGEWPAVCQKVGARTTDKGSTIVDLQWKINDPKVSEITGIESPTVRQSLFIDLDDNGILSFAKGKNVQLGKLRAATRLNDPSRPFTFSMLVGQAAKVTVKHRVGDDGQIYQDVKGVASL